MESQSPAESSTANKPKPNGAPVNDKPPPPPPPQKTSQPPIPARFANAPLFHNRKQDKDRFLKRSGTPGSTSTPSPPRPNGLRPSPGATPRPRGPPPPKVKEEEEEGDGLSGPFSGEFQEFRLMSSSLNGWKYNVMKFKSREPVDLDTWTKPIKLNRKDLKREQESRDGPGVGLPVAVKQMLGPDGKPVIGADGKIVMVDAEGKPIHGERAAEPATEKPKEKGPGRKKFQKKTRQVFLVPEATRQLRREERYPWVMEDAVGSQIWTGMLDDINKAETHAMFLPTADNVFKFVAPHRWYKLQKRARHTIPSLEEAEKLMASYEKKRNPGQWLAAARAGRKGEDSNSATVKVEENANPHIMPTTSLVREYGQSAGPGGRQLRAVVKGSLFGDDDDDESQGASRRRERELGGEGDVDELDFEEDFADDDEKYPEDNQDDEETKELEERIKKEYLKAKAAASGEAAEDTDDEDEQKLSVAGKQMRKMLKKNDKGGQYDDSDEDKNPYASSEEEDDEPDPSQIYTGPAIQAPPPRPGLQQPTTSSNGAANQPNAQVKTPVPGESGLRPTSPVPTQNGHSLVAKRATSPKAPRDQPMTGRAGSPLAQTSTTPGSPTSATKGPSHKRKAEEAGSVNGGGALKKRKKITVDPVLKKMVVDWLRNTPNASTRDCIVHFQTHLSGTTQKVEFTTLIKEVAQLKGGVLVLRNQYRRLD